MPTQLPTLTLADTDPAELAVDAIVIGVHSQAPSRDSSSGGGSGGGGGAGADLFVASGAESIVAAFDGRLVETLALLGATGAAGEVVKLATLGTVTPPLVVAVGLGPEPAGVLPDPETLRRAAGAAVRAVAGLRSVALALPTDATDTTDTADTADAANVTVATGATGAAPDDRLAALRAVFEGALLGGYRFAGYQTRAGRHRAPVRSVSVHVPEAADRRVRAEQRRAQAVARAVAQVRDWVNTPGNQLRPPAFADAVAEAATAAGLAVEVLDERQLRRGGYGGIIAVGQGSTAPPRLVRIGYTPRAARTRVALVGKGITFDSGGVSIKPAQGMWEMKSDMAGAAAVAGAMLAVAALRPKAAVTAYLPMAENMPSGSAYRPGDVVTMFNGTQVEVLNTDAEGRMVLGDAIARACQDGTDHLVEVSTLTGGQVIALGKRVAGVMGTPRLCELVRQAGEAVGEPAWPMPLPEDVRKGMDSDVADISQTNSSMDRAGHMLQGGVFLSEFVPDGIPWAHLDIAGPGYHSGEPSGYWSTGGTGVPVRTLLALIERLAAE